jgi:hypothetical protein
MAACLRDPAIRGKQIGNPIPDLQRLGPRNAA